VIDAEVSQNLKSVYCSHTVISDTLLCEWNV